jgi:hypothetical protein
MNQAAEPLASLKDIHLPAEPSWWPPAPGWWGVALLMIAIVWLGVKLWRSYRIKRQPSDALIEQLEMINLSEDPVTNHQSLMRMSALARQYAITRYGRSNIAALTGEKWIQFLDQTTDKPLFSPGAGRLLLDAPYRQPGDGDIEALKKILITWAKKSGAQTRRMPASEPGIESSDLRPDRKSTTNRSGSRTAVDNSDIESKAICRDTGAGAVAVRPGSEATN